jgi:hypothetical protein
MCSEEKLSVRKGRPKAVRAMASAGIGCRGYTDDQMIVDQFESLALVLLKAGPIPRSKVRFVLER